MAIVDLTDEQIQNREMLIAWLQSNDRNGCYADDESEAEGVGPLSLEGAQVLYFGQHSGDPELLDETVKRMKTEVLADMADGTVPVDCRSFSDLHSYVDANEYGGFTDEVRPSRRLGTFDDEIEFANLCQCAVDAWLVSGEAQRVADAALHAADADTYHGVLSSAGGETCGHCGEDVG